MKVTGCCLNDLKGIEPNKNLQSYFFTTEPFEKVVSFGVYFPRSIFVTNSWKCDTSNVPKMRKEKKKGLGWNICTSVPTSQNRQASD